MESPENLSITKDGTVLIETIDHVLYKVKEGDHFGKITPNHPENPRHIIHSSILEGTNPIMYEYSTWSPEEGIVELWRGSFLDKENR